MLPRPPQERGSEETPPRIRHRISRCGKIGVVDMISAAFGRSFCFFSPKQRSTRPHETPSDAPPGHNGGPRGGHLASASTQAGVSHWWYAP